MPLYDLEAFKTLVREGEWAYLNERRPFRTKDKLGWNDDDVAEMLCGLSANDFQKAVPNCTVTCFPTCDLVDADQYEIHWDDSEKVRKSMPTLGTISLSLKLALVSDVDGAFAGLVTLHTSPDL